MKKLPTVKIKGSDYTLVKDRIVFFNETYKNGSIQTELISDYNDKIVVVKATAIPDVGTPERKFTDYAQEVIGDGYINKTSALENCSTSAVGRALAMMGIGVIDSIASVDEITKANNRSQKPQNAPQAPSKPIPTDERYCGHCGEKATDGQYGPYCKTCYAKGIKGKAQKIVGLNELETKSDGDKAMSEMDKAFMTTTQQQPEELQQEIDNHYGN